MSKLACNVVAYRPDPAMLAARFDPRHVEVLLEQAEGLLTRAVADFREYAALDRAWQELSHDLEMQEQELELDRRRVEGEEPVAEEPAPETAAAEEQEKVEGEAAHEEAEGAAEAEAAPEAEAPGAAAEAEEPVSVTSMLELRGESIRRRRELAGAGGPLALDEQRDLVLRRLCRDYEEGLNRVAVAEEGLRRIFGYDVASPLSSWSETLGSSLASNIVWTRNALEWLALYIQSEQSFTRAFSVRALMNRNAWGQLRHARDSFSVRLQVPTEIFQGFENCRFRGVSASLLGEAGGVPWSALVRLPETAYYLRSGQRVEVDQRELPQILLGRVENRRSVRRSEFCGMVTHLNASPVGKPVNEGQWSVELLRPVGAGSELFAQVDDLVIEVKVSGVAQRTER
ncbi:hypothetical protein KP001_17710 [Geomonas subterranea]|uniref:Uncharacterized protein n=1 Tax=Geomonas subterranea TaxID=2847989 RepID=A0ABX8LDZ6_9BACT|nr:hypothetical protein [Geomonas subterranea]QXE90232.1 hypothetical protein KP001_17710 [Geomonas subterranea]QXM07642.1 hypothetical protein KP002_11575 [Geomonas subterranea]